MHWESVESFTHLAVRSGSETATKSKNEPVLISPLSFSSRPHCKIFETTPRMLCLKKILTCLASSDGIVVVATMGCEGESTSRISVVRKLCSWVGLQNHQKHNQVVSIDASDNFQLPTLLQHTSGGTPKSNRWGVHFRNSNGNSTN